MLHLNTMSPTIKFTVDNSAEEVFFLDNKVCIQNYSIQNTRYTKPIDKNSIIQVPT